jgi:hypothetical protein
MDNLQTLSSSAIKAIESAQSSQELEQLRVQFSRQKRQFYRTIESAWCITSGAKTSSGRRDKSGKGVGAECSGRTQSARSMLQKQNSNWLPKNLM